jgi:lipopolysaccharide assembly outer membrane protein LptD (OstA)
MKNMRLLTIVSVFLIACIGISCCHKQQEQVHKPDSMKMTGTFVTVAEATFPNESPPVVTEQRVKDITIEMDTLTCTADTGLFNKETGQMRLTGNVEIRTADGIKITSEEVVLGSYSPVENSNSLVR